MSDEGASRKKIIRSLGLVFGDIGTSPIYTVGAILLFMLPTVQNIFGLLSLITWTLFIVISFQYIWLAMSLSDKGEGGIIVLKNILDSHLTPGFIASGASILTILGIALFIGDGIITPAISILSAVEGIQLIPGFEGTGQITLLLIAASIAVGLFLFQKRGSDRVAFAFGPVMTVWFGALAVTGAFWESLVVMSAVILCITGGEALYADMGHLGREPIVKGWMVVFPALILNYFGQGAYVLMTDNTHNVLFSMINHISPFILVPFLILSICATVIASQAMISGMFSIVYQGMAIRIFPKMKIDYTSPEMRSQIYIDAVNWMLLAAVLVVMFEFQTSENLSAAYGLAVSGAMMISAIMMALIFLKKGDVVKLLCCFGLIIIDFFFFVATLLKIPHGAYVSFILAAIPLILTIAFIRGQGRLHELLQPIRLDEFLPRYAQSYASISKIRGTALYFISDVKNLSPYLGQVFFQNEIMYEKNVLVWIRITDKPFGVETDLDKHLGPGLELFTVRTGYMEVIDIVSLLESHGIEEKTIFYGIETIVSDKFIWKIYSIIKKVSPPFVQFYTLPQEKMHGVVTRVVM